MLEPVATTRAKLKKVSMPLRLVLTSLSYLNLICLMDSGNCRKKFNRIRDKSEHVTYLLANRAVAMRQNVLL